MGVFGRHTQVKWLFKALVFGTCKKNILIYSLKRFQLYKSHSMTSIRLKMWQKI